MDAIRQIFARAGAEPGLAEHLYLSLKCRPFVMVLGRGNTDLAALPRLFAGSVGATEENGRYLQLRVPMDWMDSSDLFGHLNLEGKFIPGGIIDFLKKAQADPDKPYFLCLDRINLSRAEYYLRELLTSTVGKTPLVPVIYYGRDEDALARYGQIPALDNLYIVGTTNLDEASLPLNQKLLDRVHTMYLEEGDLTGEASVACEALQIHNAFLQTQYFRLDQCAQQMDLLQEYFDLFAQLNRIL